ncbi:MAG: YdeI/OmpD-associated family protein [Coriobacteriia bacterium]
MAQARRRVPVSAGVPGRPRYPMPGYVQEALDREGLAGAYLERPPYQRNDYIGWITRARREETRQGRLRQMLAELERGDLYMNMPYRPRRAKREK